MPAAPPFFTRYGFSRPEEAAIDLRIEPYAEICHRGVLRPTVLASAVDLVASLHVRRLAGEDATFTGDLSLRAPARPVPASIEARGRVLRSGRRLITTAVELQAEGEPVGYGETTFTRIPRDPDRKAPAVALGVPERIPSHPLERPLAEEVGVETVDRARGRIRLPLRDALRNPEGVLQGALVALLVECAAEALADEAFGRPQIVTELDLRYLAAARVGPIESDARRIGPPEEPMLRVELRDAGQDGRPTTSALARVADARAA